MQSSKFSSACIAQKAIVVCKKGPPPSTPALPPSPPTQLNTFVDFVDLDPVAPGQQTASFQSLWNSNDEQYFGRSAPSGDRLELTFARQTNPDLWAATLAVFDSFRDPEVFFYPNIPVDPDLPFDSGRFGDVALSGTDFRVVQIME